MIRKLVVLGASLALVGSAQAQSLSQTSQTIRLDGQNARAIRTQLREAATSVCNAAARDSYTFSIFDDEATATCVSDTYAAALRRAVRLAPQAFRRVSVQTVAAR